MQLLIWESAATQSEHALLGTVFSTLPASARTSIYASLLPPSLAQLSTTGASLNALIKKSPAHQLIPLAFATYAELQERAGEFEEWVRAKAARKENEVGDLTHAFRGTCMTSLPGILEETKVRGEGRLLLFLLLSARESLRTHEIDTPPRRLGALKRPRVPTPPRRLSSPSQ